MSNGPFRRTPVPRSFATTIRGIPFHPDHTGTANPWNRRWLCEDSLKTSSVGAHSCARHHEAMEKTPGAPMGAYRALVVDDEVPLTQVLASYLEREHFEVSVAHNGADGPGPCPRNSS